MIKILIVKPILTDSEVAGQEGYFMNSANFPTVITEDCDVYIETDNGKRKLLLKFRKSVFAESLCQQAFKALESASKMKRNNRGAAAGLLDIAKLPKYVKSIVKQDKFRIYYIGLNGKLAKTHLSNYVASNIIGYYDQADRNLLVRNLHKTRKTSSTKTPKCRPTQFTRKYPTKWETVLPLLKAIDGQFAKLLPEEHRIQLTNASITPNFQIDGTAFSTATINYNYRTALHRDKGDFEQGFGNLVVLEKSPEAYIGGWTGFPQYGVAVDVRQGDFLAMDVHQWHGNIEITPSTTSTPPDSIGRLALVCYLRKNMIKCNTSTQPQPHHQPRSPSFQRE
jgi:hypothetical protein